MPDIPVGFRFYFENTNKYYNRSFDGKWEEVNSDRSGADVLSDPFDSDLFDMKALNLLTKWKSDNAKNTKSS